MPPTVVSQTEAAVDTAPVTAKDPKARGSRAKSFVPRLRLVGEGILVDMSEGIVPDYREVETAVLHLSFAYDGAEVAAGDVLTHVRGKTGTKLLRDFAGEARARQLLESYGPLELDSLDTHAAMPDSTADYVVDLEGDIDNLCAFSASAVPKLRALGWHVEVADDYPCRVVKAEHWYADIDGKEESDWFELELGVECQGQRVDLLPALLDLLHESGSASNLDAKLRRARRPVAVPLQERTFLSVPPERLRAIVAVLAELYATEGTGENGLRVPKLDPSYFGELEDALGEQAVHWHCDELLRKRSKALIVDETPPLVQAPTALKATLRPYQQEGLNWLQNLRRHGLGGVLADDMGLGKTLQTIAHIVTERASGRATMPIMVVAPTSLTGNWKREMEKFAPSVNVVEYHGAHRAKIVDKLPNADVIVTSYPIVTRDREVLEKLEFHLIVLDEAQVIKNVRSQAHKAVKALDAQFRLCLSGTPIENNLEELWALFDFVMPGLLGSVEQFRVTFRAPIEKLGHADRLAVLRRRVSPFILRRMKESVAKDLPSKTEIVRGVDLVGDQRDLYEAIRIAAHAEVRKVVRKKGIAASTIDILGALMKLRQVCCDPTLLSVKAAKEVERSAKLEALLEMLDEMLSGGRRILIFSQFTSMLAIIAERLRERKVRYVTLTGATSDRQQQVDTFQDGKAEVFLISLKAGGCGLNLTRADTVIHFDPWWNPQAQAQATDRAYRIGQQNPVFVYNLIVAGSVEERMLALQQRKRELADGLLAPGESATELSERDVDDLFAPLE